MTTPDNYKINLQQNAEVNWYRDNGRFSLRIVPDNLGQLYVLGDLAWNRKNPLMKEQIDLLMPEVKT
jgi:hypothetical protein